MTADKLIAAKHNAELHYDDSSDISAALKDDVAEAKEQEIADAVAVAAKRANVEARGFAQWTSEQRGRRPKSELTFDNYIHDLDLVAANPSRPISPSPVGAR
jgi:hypothetical protein